MDGERPDGGDALLDALRGAAAEVDPVPADVRARVHAAFVLSVLEPGVSGPVGGGGQSAPPHPDA